MDKQIQNLDVASHNEQANVISSSTAEKSQTETQSYRGKNSINIAIDFEMHAVPPININVHTIVEGKIREQYNVPYNGWAMQSFKKLWDDIGKQIEQHMRDNPDYYPFGS